MLKLSFKVEAERGASAASACYAAEFKKGGSLEIQ
jgi:hypothetical protein